MQASLPSPHPSPHSSPSSQQLTLTPEPTLPPVSSSLRFLGGSQAEFPPALRQTFPTTSSLLQACLHLHNWVNQSSPQNCPCLPSPPLPATLEPPSALGCSCSQTLKLDCDKLQALTHIFKESQTAKMLYTVNLNGYKKCNFWHIVNTGNFNPTHTFTIIFKGI